MAEQGGKDLPSDGGCYKGSAGMTGGADAAKKSSDGQFVEGLESVAGRAKFLTPREFMAERERVKSKRGEAACASTFACNICFLHCYLSFCAFACYEHCSFVWGGLVFRTSRQSDPDETRF